MSSAPKGWVDRSAEVNEAVAAALKESRVRMRWDRVRTYHALGTGLGWDGLLVKVGVLWGPDRDTGFSITWVEGKFREHELGLIPQRMVELVCAHIDEGEAAFNG